MASEYTYLYRGSRSDAVRNREIDLWEPSFRENVACARAIEKALRHEYDKTGPIPPDCASRVLEEYGFKRVRFVLASTVSELKDVPVVRQQLSDEARKWAKECCVEHDPVYARYYCVDTATVLLDGFIHQAMEEYRALGLFGNEHCTLGMYDENVTDRVLVMKPETLKESCWSQENQLWLAVGGFGCDPKAGGRAIYATCLSDGERTRWNREDFLGVLDEQYMPEWARRKLEDIRAPRQNAAPSMGGMELR